MNIAIGSASKLKINALTAACDELEITQKIVGVEVASGQNAQPVNIREIMEGAITRALGAQKNRPDYFGLGIESGIVRFDIGEERHFIDLAGIVLITPEGRIIFGNSCGVEIPIQYVEMAAQAGFNCTTVGAAISEERGGSPEDPHSTLTDGRLSREEILTQGIISVFKQL